MLPALCGWSACKWPLRFCSPPWCSTLPLVFSPRLPRNCPRCCSAFPSRAWWATAFSPSPSVFGRQSSRNNLFSRLGGVNACSIWRTKVLAVADNRTEQGTLRRRQDARKKGQVVRSRDLVSALTLLSVVLFLAWHPEVWIGRWASLFARS